MCLIDLNLAAMAQVEEPLLRVHVAARCDPRRGVDGRRPAGAVQMFEINDQRDRIFRVDALSCGQSRSSRWRGRASVAPDAATAQTLKSTW